MLCTESSTEKAKGYNCTKTSLLLKSLNVIGILIRFVLVLDSGEFSHIKLINVYLAVFVIVVNEMNFYLIIWVFYYVTVLAVLKIGSRFLSFTAV
jgi:hypothetical protein